MAPSISSNEARNTGKEALGSVVRRVKGFFVAGRNEQFAGQIGGERCLRKKEHISAGSVAEAEEQIDHVLGEEYEHKPVPLSARRSLFSVTMVWIGFPMIITGAMTGSVLVLGDGLSARARRHDHRQHDHVRLCRRAGRARHQKGMNFALIASIVFGRKGYVFSSGLLSTLLLGWYAVQTGITGNLISSTYHLNYVLMTVIAGVLYIAITFVGVRGLHYIGLVSVPLFVVLGVWVAADSVANHGWAAVMSYAGADGKGAMSMGVGLTIVSDAVRRCRAR